MGKAHNRSGEFRKVGQNLFRYSANKVYYAIYKIAGKKIWKSLETTDRELAQRRLKEELGKNGLVEPAKSAMTLAELLAMYESSLQAFAARTTATRRSIVNVFKTTWNPGLTLPVRTITAGQLQLWLGQHRSRLRNSSLNEYIRFVRQLFLLAVSHKVIAESPAAMLKQLRLEKPVRATPTWDQFQAIVRNIREQTQNADAEESADLVEFMGTAGVGTAECSGLRGEHFDFARQRIVLYRMKTDQGYEIPMFPQVMPLIEKWRACGRFRVGEPVFHIREPKKSLANACKRLGFPHFSPRSLRRCFVTRAVERGVDFKTLASWQGHQDGGVLIARTYSHLRTEHSDRMALKLT